MSCKRGIYVTDQQPTRAEGASPDPKMIYNSREISAQKS